MRAITVPLEDHDAAALADLARAELRLVRKQAAYLLSDAIRRELRRRERTGPRVERP